MKEFPLDRTEVRQNFRHFLTIPTRWSDNDQYGHVNNAKYLTFFELIIMRYLEVDSAIDVAEHGVRCFSVENMCRYISPVKYPDTLEAGLRVGKLGNSSVRYEVGLFISGDDSVSATGYFTDVFVNDDTEKPVSIPDPIRQVLQRLVVTD
ncbi:MAG: thioesterase family protein [Pseudomonadota bacterium]